MRLSGLKNLTRRTSEFSFNLLYKSRIKCLVNIRSIFHIFLDLNAYKIICNLTFDIYLSINEFFRLAPRQKNISVCV